MTRFLLSSATAIIFAAGAAQAAQAPFDLYKRACLDTLADGTAIRAAATAQGWAQLTPEEREAIAPGNGEAVEGWAIGQGGQRFVVSIVARTIRGGISGDREGGAEASCTLSGPKGDDAAMIDSYAKQLNRKPSEDTTVEGQRTAVWNVINGPELRMHYYFGVKGQPASSTFSLSVLKK